LMPLALRISHTVDAAMLPRSSKVARL
jgi:hypothetical protein